MRRQVALYEKLQLYRISLVSRVRGKGTLGEAGAELSIVYGNINTYRAFTED